MGMYETVRRDEDPLVLDANTPENLSADVESSLLNSPRSDGSGRGGGNASKRRLVSLDVFRGLTVAIMILVDDAGGILPAINHSPWNGLTLADFVMPFFLFIVGVHLPLHTRYLWIPWNNLSSGYLATKMAVVRALKLLVFGLFLQGGYFHGLNNLTYGVDIEQIRLAGILQRIAVAYFLAAVCEIWLKGDNNVKSGSSLLKKYQFQWAVVLVLTVAYCSLLYGLYVPDWEYSIPSETSSSALKIFKQCSINSPDYGPLPPNAPTWCQAPFDPEGLLSSVMAIVTCLVGLHYGHIIVHFKDHKDRILHWIVPSSCLLVLGFALDFFV
ncbi:Heparan-alpha-glucosaminide N-acetyltransferase [Vitis vinifera]|uniref:Heparan-alpha-glucosaminide N-acetyltransferase n=1 Tax=Vitis vinifera TaxID=29760 RepID=A0A438CTA4_VITVI|nr:Heparan-alpha-glucosaminide N-acetyltransferase [Vitis vinifera]